MPKDEGFQGVSNLYVFKSQLQEYAQKVGIPTPVYETLKEGPSHEPSFKSTVIVNNVRYDSLLGFSNRKKAEHSAAEVALGNLAKSSHADPSISQPIHETGLCKNLLQEYAQKMNYAIPSYQCQKEGTRDRVPLFSCTVEIGGIRYVGAAAKTKKEAEIKVARTALLAIQSSKSETSVEPVGNTNFIVLPSKKRRAESITNSEETADVPKPKKARRRKRRSKKKFSENKVGQTQAQNACNWGKHRSGSEISGGESGISKPMAAFRPKKTIAAFRLAKAMAAEGTPNGHDWMSHVASVNQTSALEYGFVPQTDGSAENGQSIASYFNHGDKDTLDAGASAISYGATIPQVTVGAENWQRTTSSFNHGQEGTLDVEVPDSYGNITPLAQEVNTVSRAAKPVSVENNSDIPYLEASTLVDEHESKPQEVNMVSGAGEPVSLADNHGIPYIEASSVIASLNQSEDEFKPREVNMVSGELVSLADNSDTAYLEASSVTAGLNQSEDEFKPREVNMASGAAEPVSLAENSDKAYREASSVIAGMNQSEDESKAREVNMVSGEAQPVSLAADNSETAYLETSSVTAGPNQSEDEVKPQEVNVVVSGSVQRDSVEDNTGIPYLGTSSLMAGPNQSEDEFKLVQQI